MMLTYWLKTNTIKKNTEVLLCASKESDLEGNVEKTRHMFMYHHQNAGQNHNLMTTNKAFKKKWQS